MVPGHEWDASRRWVNQLRGPIDFSSYIRACCHCVLKGLFKPLPYILLSSMCSVIWNLGLTEYGCTHKIVMRSSSTEWLPYQKSTLMYVSRLLVLSGLTLFLLHSCTSLPISRRAGFEFASLHKCNLWCLMLEKRNYFSWSWLCINSLLFVLSFNMGLVIGKQPPLSCHILIGNSTRHLLRDTHPWHKFHVIIKSPMRYAEIVMDAGASE